MQGCGSSSSGDSSPTVRWSESQTVEAKEFYAEAISIASPNMSSDQKKSFANCVFELIEPRMDYKTWEVKAGEDDVTDEETRTCYNKAIEKKKETADAKYAWGTFNHS